MQFFVDYVRLLLLLLGCGYRGQNSGDSFGLDSMRLEVDSARLCP